MINIIDKYIIMDPFWKNRNTITIPNTTFTLTGYSIGSVRQVFYIKELDILLDCGISPSFLPSKIFITHGHLDHVAGIPQVCLNGRETKIFTPKALESRMKNFLRASYDMEGRDKENYEIVGLNCNITINEKLNTRNFNIETFRCFHTIPTIGYGFIENRRKIKKEYSKLQKDEITKLVKENKEITDNSENYTFCYLGDTTIKVFRQKNIFKYKTIICECTYYDEDTIKDAKDTKHIHFMDIREIIKEHNDNYFILIHKNDRFRNTEINKYIEEFDNCFVWKN